MRHATLLGLLTAATGAALLLGACGDTEETSSGSTSSSATTTTSTSDATTTTSAGGGEGGMGMGGMGHGGMNMGGMGGEGGMGECATPEDCPGTDDECQARTCDNAICGVAFTAIDTATSTQTDADCKINVCDGAGSEVSSDDDTDIFDDGNECTTDTCDTGQDVHTPELAGTACTQGGGAVCDGAGSCVACVVDGDCNGTDVCQANLCVPTTCMDGSENGTETDVDCGGNVCAPCPVGLACTVGADCSSGVCTGSVCQAPTCSDAIKNGAETGIDCGSGCPGCATGQACLVSTDCASFVCQGLLCKAPSCTDLVKNGTESDVDCGMVCATKCGFNQMCGANGDCVGNSCVGGLCAAACNDGVKNGAETDVDCGGGTCNGCGFNKICTLGTDCLGGTCTGGLCAAACNDQIKNGTETDVDCGGSCATKCAIGKTCGTGTDCTSTACYINTCAQFPINGCGNGGTAFVAPGANNTVTTPGNNYSPPCVVVAAGTTVTFSASGQHPLFGGRVAGMVATPDATTPFPNNAATDSAIPFTAAESGKIYGFYCGNHYGGGMYGAVLVQ